MLEIGEAEAKDRWSELLAKVEAGEEVVITRAGRATARLVRIQAPVPHDRQRALEAIERIKARRVSLGDLNIKEMIEEGRR